MVIMTVTTLISTISCHVLASRKEEKSYLEKLPYEEALWGFSTNEFFARLYLN
jgi:hypothetical protein